MACHSCKHGYNTWSARHCYYEEQKPYAGTCYRYEGKASTDNSFIAAPATGNEPIKIIDIYPSTPVESTPSPEFSSGSGGDFGGGGSDGSW